MRTLCRHGVWWALCLLLVTAVAASAALLGSPPWQRVLSGQYQQPWRDCGDLLELRGAGLAGIDIDTASGSTDATESDVAPDRAVCVWGGSGVGGSATVVTVEAQRYGASLRGTGPAGARRAWAGRTAETAGAEVVDAMSAAPSSLVSGRSGTAPATVLRVSSNVLVEVTVRKGPEGAPSDIAALGIGQHVVERLRAREREKGA
ncbi:hypothetical protein [Nocardiopsis ansamitocini]|uniref:Secreted protein n=1 Tax=Nocardiopsis ansamitocini TaxID=1670832 RepID=A0A9W6P8V1_9ACTN|nr:hypothetical protein [Nocardiopsis ansamitocini]GLU49735.1 hypothetical protein Nans01_40860 [Nocardiopsis ansamitocini]